MDINPIILIVTIIIQIQGGKIIGSASGFFYEQDGKLYLVTNKHVFIDKQKNIIPDQFKLILHKDANDIRKNGEYFLSLYKDSNKLWKTHPKFYDADVALIEIDKNDIMKEFVIKAFSRQSFLPDNYPLHPGEDIFIMGYPLSFHDSINNLPIFRNAMIASTYGVYFQGMPLFLTDANLHPGTSGSPVITKPKSTWVDDKGNTNFVTGTPYYLIGVHSGTIDPKITNNQEIGLGASWYSKLIEDIAATF
jgi:hypothetical protein